MGQLKLRIKTGFSLILLFAIFLTLPSLLVVGCLFVMGLLSARELAGIFCNIEKNNAYAEAKASFWKRKKFGSLILIILGLSWVTLGLLLGGMITKTMVNVGIFSVICALCSVLGQLNGKMAKSLTSIPLMKAAVVLLLGMFLFGVYFLHQENQWALMLLVGITAISDLGGYFFGKLLKSRKVFPQLSPKKTLNGTIAMVVLPLACALVLSKHTDHFFPLYATIGIFALVGDLWISQMKRMAGMKDSGNLLPGHGGILDRIDSHMMVISIATILIFAY